jgi:sugar lactone lactonase YvrE
MSKPFLALFAPLVLTAAPVTEITLPGTLVFPESITSTSNGTLIIGSFGHGNVLRALPGKQPEEWIKSGTGGLGSVLGVFADEKSKLLWVCSNKLGNTGDATSVKTFDLKTGAPKSTYPLPGSGAFCNDIAIASDGTAYLSDTLQGSIVMLKPGAKDLEVAAKDTKLAGADGLAFGSKTTLYVNSVTTNKLLRLELGPDGHAKDIAELKLSRPIDRPDGFRAIGPNKFLQAENSGKMSVVKIDGDTATITTIKEVSASTPGVTATKGMAWVVEGKLDYRNNPALKDKDPGTFKLYAVPLPK